MSKKSLNETRTTFLMDSQSKGTASEAPTFESLQKTLKQIKRDGVVGYILKDDKKAAIDIDDPMKILEYAMLSSQAFCSSEDLPEDLDIGKVESILVEGGDLRVLCVNVGKNMVSLFIEKNRDYGEVLKRLLS